MLIRGGHPRVGTRRKSRLREFIGSLAVALVLFLVIRTFLLQAFRIPSASMEDTLLIGDFLFINKIEYGAKIPFTPWRLPGLRDVGAGDVIVFRFPGTGEKRDFIKRCVAVAGQTVEMRSARLYVDGQLVDEPHAKHVDSRRVSARDDFGPLLVPPGHLFMLGDNRDCSQDSRGWGTLPLESVHGRAFIRYFSWDPVEKTIRWKRLLTLL
jgi:signal peptidase I